jgi:sugar O-acyltransferase (sialic acid O-acetyltransferase NeuD family)
MLRRLIILGTSGLAREVALVVEQINKKERRWTISGFVGISNREIERNIGIHKILGDDEWLLSQNETADLAVGIGRPGIRAKVLSRYLERKDQFQYPNMIHPKACFDHRKIEMGCGNIVTAGSCFTCDIVVRNFNYFNLNTTIGHDTYIGSFNVINPGVNISGGVRIEDRVLIGTGSQILEDISIGSDAVIGAGAVVCKNVLSGQTVVGAPARPIQRA